MSLFYDYNQKPLLIENLYRGQRCFLICGGPSLKAQDLSVLRQPGIVTMGVNNSPAVFRPNLWVSVDFPGNFLLSIWRDPLIMKFCMHGKRNKQLWNSNTWDWSGFHVNDCPNIVYYKDNEYFRPQKFLIEDTVNWGNHSERCECGVMKGTGPDGKKDKVCKGCGEKLFGCRSVMLAALKILYRLGFAEVYLLGADFKMDTDNKYAFDQGRSDSSVKNNNNTYSRLNMRFDRLRPVFEQAGFYVFNATPDSGLLSFPMVSLPDAVRMATGGFPCVSAERTYGMYERHGLEEKVEKEGKNIEKYKHEISKVNGSDPKKLKRWRTKLEKAQSKYNSACEELKELAQWTA